MENPRVPYVAQRSESVMTHVTRSRQLLTNPNHAARQASRLATREYQCDSPSAHSLLPVFHGSRDGPALGDVARELDRLVHIRGRSYLCYLLPIS
jgi:hypothetical protein